MRNMIGGYGWNEYLSLHGWNAFELASNQLRSLAIFSLHGGIVLLKKPIHGRNQADDLFFGNLHASANGIRVGRIVLARSFDQILAAQQQSRALGATQALASRKRHQIES